MKKVHNFFYTDENVYQRKKEYDDLNDKYLNLAKRYENLIEEKDFMGNKIKTEIKALVDKLLQQLNSENAKISNSLVSRDISFIYKSILNLIDLDDQPILAPSGGSSRNILKTSENEYSVQINNNNI